MHQTDKQFIRYFRRELLLTGVVLLGLLGWAFADPVPVPHPPDPPPVGSLPGEEGIRVKCVRIVGSRNPVTNTYYKVATTNLPAGVKEPTEESYNFRKPTPHATFKTAPTNAFAGYIDMSVELETSTNLADWQTEAVPFKHKADADRKFFRLPKAEVAK